MLRRKDSFFGLHFDYHANADTKDIGKDFDEKVLERIITEVNPDFIQCDTKGHPRVYVVQNGSRHMRSASCA